jgi:hypothetical protein
MAPRSANCSHYGSCFSLTSRPSCGSRSQGQPAPVSRRGYGPRAELNMIIRRCVGVMQSKIINQCWQTGDQDQNPSGGMGRRGSLGSRCSGGGGRRSLPLPKPDCDQRVRIIKPTYQKGRLNIFSPECAYTITEAPSYPSTIDLDIYRQISAQLARSRSRLDCWHLPSIGVGRVAIITHDGQGSNEGEA